MDTNGDGLPDTTPGLDFGVDTNLDGHADTTPIAPSVDPGAFTFRPPGSVMNGDEQPDATPEFTPAHDPTSYDSGAFPGHQNDPGNDGFDNRQSTHVDSGQFNPDAGQLDGLPPPDWKK